MSFFFSLLIVVGAIFLLYALTDNGGGCGAALFVLFVAAILLAAVNTRPGAAPPAKTATVKVLPKSETPRTPEPEKVTPPKVERSFTMPEIPQLIIFGGAAFWLYLVVLTIALGFLIEFERGLFATAALVVALVALFWVSDLTAAGTGNFIARHPLECIGIVVGYFVIGYFSMRIHWKALGKTQTAEYNALRADWLRDRGQKDATTVPNHLLGDWDVYVKGDAGGDSLQIELRDTRQEFMNPRGGWDANVPSDLKEQWIDVCVIDPLLGEETSVTKGVKRIRSTWLTAHGVFDTHVVPVEYRDWFTTRILQPAAYVPVKPHDRLLYLSTEPTVHQLVDRLARWWIWWVIDLPLLFLRDGLVRFCKHVIMQMRARLQKIMSAIYADVRKDFRPPSDVDE